MGFGIICLFVGLIFWFLDLYFGCLNLYFGCPDGGSAQILGINRPPKGDRSDGFSSMFIVFLLMFDDFYLK